MSFELDETFFKKFRNYTHFATTLKGTTLEVHMTKKKPCNTMTKTFFNELYHIFTTINNLNDDIRCVLLFSSFKNFSFGLDCKLLKSKTLKNHCP